MLHRDSREIVNTGDHLMTRGDETACGSSRFGRSTARPKPVSHPCAAHADPDGNGPDTPSTTDEICGAFDMGVPPGDIPGRLGQNDGRWNYWRAQQRTSQTIIGGDCG
jgi:hypothetical protein